MPGYSFVDESPPMLTDLWRHYMPAFQQGIGRSIRYLQKLQYVAIYENFGNVEVEAHKVLKKNWI